MTDGRRKYGRDEVSPLTLLGYKAGDNGEPKTTRRRILANAFQGTLPSAQSPEYMAQWGNPDSEKRLKRIAEQVAGNARKERLKEEPSVLSIKDWEGDLSWLHETFYVGRFNFPWPTTR